MHKGILGYGTADMLAKESTGRPSDDLSPPVKIQLRAHFMKQWQNHCDYTDTGRLVYPTYLVYLLYSYYLVPEVSLDLFMLTHSTSAICGKVPFFVENSTYCVQKYFISYFYFFLI